MTFTEAAVEVLRRVGKPLHFKDIAAQAMEAGLLSHVGQTPEATMGARLLALAKREHDRKVVSTDVGVFGLPEWGVALAQPALGPEVNPPEDAPAYRARERHPPLQDELVVGARREDRRRSRDDEGDGKRRKRYAPPAEVAHAALREKNTPLSLADLVALLRTTDKVAEALERDLGSFEKALREENRRRAETNRTPMFEFGENGLVTGLELPKDLPRPAPRAPEAKPPRREEPPPRPPALDEQRRQVIRQLRRRLGQLDVSSLERVVVALLEAQGYRELNLARRSVKDGPLYLARHRWGAGDLRYAARVLRPGRELGRQEVQDVRRDLQHYSAQLGIVFGAGECSREARSEANLPGTPPVMLYGAEALAESLIEAGLGVTRRVVEWIEYDDAFFAQMGAGAEAPEVAEIAPETAPQSPSDEPRPPRDEQGRRGRRDRRDRRGREGDRPDQGPAPAAGSEASEGRTPEGATESSSESTPAPVEPASVESAPVESAPVEPAPVAAEAAPVPVEPAPAEQLASAESPQPQPSDDVPQEPGAAG